MSSSLAAQILLSENPEPIILHGLAGIGKSAVAAGLAWGLAPYYHGGVLLAQWIGRRLVALCDEIGRLCVDDSMLSMDFVNKLKQAHLLLNRRPTLVILDGCENRDVVQVFAEQCAPQGLVITTRKKISLVGKLIEVRPLVSGSAMQLFRTVAELPHGYTNEVERLVSLFDGHPQAVAISGALCLEENLTPEALLLLLEPAEDRVQRLRLGLELKNSVWASFEASYNQLNSHEQRLLCILGGAWAKTVTVELSTYVAGLPDTKVGDELLRGLVKHHLLEIAFDNPGAPRIYHIHELVRAYAQGLLHERGHALEGTRADWLSGAVRYAQIHAQSDPANHKALELEMDNLLGAAGWAHHHQRWADVNTLALMLWNCGIMELRGYARRGFELLEEGVSASRKLDNPKDEAIHLGNLATASFLLGKYQLGTEYAEQALTIVRILGDRAREETILEVLAFHNLTLGNSAQGKKILEDAVVIAREIRDEKRESTCLGYLALSYFQLGYLIESLKLFDQAVRIARRIGDRVNEGRHLSRMGDVYIELDDYECAIAQYSLAIDIAREHNNLTGEHWDLAGLGKAYLGLCQFDCAIELLKEALQIARSIEHHEGQAYRLGELASALGKAGRAAEGSELAQEAIAIASNIGHRRCETMARLAWAECAFTLGEKGSANLEAERALEIATAIEDQELQADALHLLGTLALKENKIPDAHCYLQKELIHRQETHQQQRTKRVQLLLAQLPKLAI